MTRPLRPGTAGWIAAACAAGLALAGCIFLDWSVPATGADAGAEAGACGAASSCDDQNDCTDDACDASSLACVHTPRPSGSPCTSGGGQVCDGSGACVGGRVIWARTFKASSASSSMGHVSVDPAGDVSLVGSVSGAIDLGGGPAGTADGGVQSLGLGSYRGDGTYRWSVLHGASGATVTAQGGADAQGQLLATATLSGGAVDFGLGKVAGPGSESALVLARYTDAGSPFFVRSFAGATADAGVAPVALSDDPGGNAYVLASFNGAVDLGSAKIATGNRFVASFDVGGAYRWSTPFTDNTFLPPTLAVDPARGALVAGSFAGTVDLGNTKYNLTTTTAAIFVARLRLADGAVDWSKSFDLPMGLGQPTAIAVDPAGDILLAGVLTGPLSFGGATLGAPCSFVAKLDPTGKHLWSRAVGSDAAITPVYVASAGTDTVLAGVFSNAVDLGDGQFVASSGKHDLYVARYDAAGALLWKQTFGDAAEQSISGLGVGSDGSVFVSGGDQGAVTFGGKILPDAGTPGGLFLIKLAP